MSLNCLALRTCGTTDMSFINEINSKENRIWERGYCLKWTIDYNKKAYLVGNGTNRFGYTKFRFCYDAEISEAHIRPGNTIDCQAKRVLDETKHAIYYTLYLPRLDQYPEEVIEWIKEAILIYGLDGKETTDWLVSLEVIDEQVPDYFPKVAFRNESIPKEFQEETTSSYRAIDPERDIWLCRTSQGWMKSFVYYFYWRDVKVASFTAEESIYIDDRDCCYMVLACGGIGVEPSYEDYREDISAMIEEAFHVYGSAGNSSRPEECYVDFKLNQQGKCK